MSQAHSDALAYVAAALVLLDAALMWWANRRREYRVLSLAAVLGLVYWAYILVAIAWEPVAITPRAVRLLAGITFVEAIRAIITFTRWQAHGQ